MATSTIDFQSIIRHGSAAGFGVNDNQPLPSQLRRAVMDTSAFVRTDTNFDVDLPTLETRLERESGILWASMKHQTRACYTPELVADSREYQRFLKEQLQGRRQHDMPFRYLVWNARSSSAFSLGGDLSLFAECVRDGNEQKLRRYAYQCIDVLYDNYNAMDLPVLTVALVQGDAIGGGFESMITNDIVIAERDAKFGLPEVLFNLFPGMGGYSFLVRKVGETNARALVEDGRTRSAEEMHALGLIDVLAEPGEGEATLRAFLADQDKKFATTRTMRRACKRVDPIKKTELLEIVDLWIELAMDLEPSNLRRMDCLARVQEKKRAKN